MKGIGIGIAAAVAVLAVGIAGCGSDDSDDSTTTTAAITKDEFITQGNQICTDVNKTLDSEAGNRFAQGQRPSDQEILDFQADVVIPATEDAIAQMKALGIPAGDEEQVNAMIDSADSAVATMQEDVDSGTVSRDDPFAETNRLFKEYGLTECD